MLRRTFLKLILGGAAGAAASALPFPLSVLDAAATTPSNASQVGLFRETAAYDAYTDSFMVRFDAVVKSISGLSQYGIDLRVASLDNLDEERKEALKMLCDNLRADGFTASDLITLPAIESEELQTKFIGAFF